MKKLKEFGEALLFILCVIVDCIIFPIQKLFKCQMFQITQYYIQCITKLKLKK
jgi:hypothetical protein